MMSLLFSATAGSEVDKFVENKEKSKYMLYTEIVSVRAGR